MIELSVDQLGLFLIVFVFASGAWNAAVGPGGGVTFATLAAVFSPGVAIPIHAVVEGASGAARGWVLRDQIQGRFLGYFVLGGIPGFAAGLLLLDRFSIDGPILRIAVGVVIVITAWMPLRAGLAVGGRRSFGLGVVTAILGLVVGGMQVLVATSLRSNGVDQRSVVATSTAAVLFQFAVKLGIFGLVGFSFATYGGLLVVLTVASLAGTWLGCRVSLDLVPQEAMSLLFRFVVTAIGCFIVGRSIPEVVSVSSVTDMVTSARPATLAVLATYGCFVVWLSWSLAAAETFPWRTFGKRPQPVLADQRPRLGTGELVQRTESNRATLYGPPSPEVTLSRLIAESVPDCRSSRAT